MHVQSISLTENLNSKNRSFKAQFVPNEMFHNLWRETCEYTNVYHQIKGVMAVVASRFSNINDHILEILSVSPDKYVTVLNHSNGKKVKYHCKDVNNSTVLTVLFNLLCKLEYSNDKIYRNLPVESINSLADELPPIFVDDKKGLYKELLELAKNDHRFPNILECFTQRYKGHSFEITDKASFRCKGTDCHDYTVFDYRTGKNGKYRLTGGQSLVNLMKKIRKIDSVTSTDTTNSYIYNKLTGIESIVNKTK